MQQIYGWLLFLFLFLFSIDATEYLCRTPGENNRNEIRRKAACMTNFQEKTVSINNNPIRCPLEEYCWLQSRKRRAQQSQSLDKRKPSSFTSSKREIHRAWKVSRLHVLTLQSALKTLLLIVRWGLTSQRDDIHVQVSTFIYKEVSLKLLNCNKFSKNQSGFYVVIVDRASPFPRYKAKFALGE